MSRFPKYPAVPSSFSSGIIILQEWAKTLDNGRFPNGTMGEENGESNLRKWACNIQKVPTTITWFVAVAFVGLCERIKLVGYPLSSKDPST